MKQLLLVIAVLFFWVKVTAQSRYTTTKYNKADVGAIVAEYPFIEGTVKDGLKEHFEKLGYKGKSAKAGFVLFAGVNIAEISDSPLDIYILVDRKSRQEKDKAIATVMFSKGFENFVTDESDSKVIANAKDYFDKLKENLIAYDLELQIAEQENALSKADKKYLGLVDDGEKLAKRKKEIEHDIVENTNAQTAQKAEADKQRQMLEILKAKRKGATPAPTPAEPAKQ